MRLGTLKSMTMTRSDRRMVLAFTGGIPSQVLNFESEAELLEKWDELTAIEEAEKNAEPS